MYAPARTAATLLALYAAATFESHAAAPLTAEDHDAIVALTEKYAEYVVAGDWVRWADLFHHDAVRIYPGMHDLVGRETIRGHAEAFHRSLDSSVKVVEFSIVEIAGTLELAYARGTLRSEGTIVQGGQDVQIEVAATWLAIVRKDAGGTWRFHRFIHADL